MADAVQALKQKKIDCVIIDEQPALSVTKYNSNSEIIEHSLVKEYTKDDIENVAKVKRNPLLERLDKVRQQEEYAKQLQKETENKEFNLVYDKVKEILPRAKELHELRKEFNYPQTAMNPFFSEYPEFCPYRRSAI